MAQWKHRQIAMVEQKQRELTPSGEGFRLEDKCHNKLEKKSYN